MNSSSKDVSEPHVDIAIRIGIMGRNIADESREWWSRLGGWFFMFLVASSGACSFWRTLAQYDATRKKVMPHMRVR